jgi:hypothetical protein
LAPHAHVITTTNQSRSSLAVRRSTAFTRGYRVTRQRPSSTSIGDSELPITLSEYYNTEAKCGEHVALHLPHVCIALPQHFHISASFRSASWAQEYIMRIHVSRSSLTFLQILSVTMLLVTLLLIGLARFTTVSGLHDFRSHSEAGTVHDKVLVNLGYEIYAGVFNSSTSLNVFKGFVLLSA